MVWEIPQEGMINVIKIYGRSVPGILERTWLMRIFLNKEKRAE
jgi:hypothetical protein